MRACILGSLVIANLVLLGWLVAGVANRKEVPELPHTVVENTSTATRVVQATNQNVLPANPTQRVMATEASTPFQQVYSPDPNQFVANLRAIHCPEETIKDILTDEIHRRFQREEAALRQKPGDHVPVGWSPKTTEPKLLLRRQGAAALAREEAALLREALGYEVEVRMPLYATTVSEQRFQESLNSRTPETNRAARQANENYWAAVLILQDRTKGFWLPEDISELERLKSERRQALARLLPPQ